MFFIFTILRRITQPCHFVCFSRFCRFILRPRMVFGVGDGEFFMFFIFYEIFLWFMIYPPPIPGRKMAHIYWPSPLLGSQKYLFCVFFGPFGLRNSAISQNIVLFFNFPCIVWFHKLFQLFFRNPYEIWVIRLQFTERKNVFSTSSLTSFFRNPYEILVILLQFTDRKTFSLSTNEPVLFWSSPHNIDQILKSHPF